MGCCLSCCCCFCCPQKTEKNIQSPPQRYIDPLRDFGSTGKIIIPNSNQGSLKMPCDHTITKKQLLSHLDGLIKKRQNIINCPIKGCNREWDYTNNIKKYLSQDEHFYGDMLSEIMVQKMMNNTNQGRLKPIKPKPQQIRQKFQPIRQKFQPIKLQTQLIYVAHYSSVPIQVKGIDGTIKSTNIDIEATGFVLKYVVYQLFRGSLNVEKMQLFIGDVQIKDDQQLKMYLKKQNISTLITQKRLSIRKIPGLKKFKYNQLNDQQQTQMPCKHFIGQQGLRSLISHSIQQRICSIKCSECSSQWDYQLCKKIAVLTRQQQNNFSDRLALIKMGDLGNKCPNTTCQANVYLDLQNTNRVRCPVCKMYDYCYRCQQKWKSSNNFDCGNDDCEGICAQLLHINPEGAILDMYVNGKSQKKKLPAFRACPQCAFIINYKDRCKHMNCPKCKNSFCWCCLSIKNNGNWSCGGYDNYCGKIAPIQDYAQLSKKIKQKTVS